MRLPNCTLAFLACATLWAGCGSDEQIDPASGDAAARPPLGASSGETVATARLLGEMIDLDHLTRTAVPAYVTRQASSYNRASVTADDPEGWFANDDYTYFVRTEATPEGPRSVLADIDGPGAVVRIWTASARGTLRIFVDDMETPVIEEELRALLGGEVPPFVAPFAYEAARGFNLYFPILFSERCVITTDDPGDEPFYYHVGYRLYAKDVNVEPFSIPTLQTLEEQVSEVGTALVEGGLVLSSQATRHDFELSGDGAAVEFEAPVGGGVIRALELRPSTLNEQTLRQSVVHIEFDDQPTISAPIVALFGSGPGIHPYDSYVASIKADGSLQLLWPMPFGSNAKMSLTSIDGTAIQVTGAVVIEPRPFENDTMLLHARWHASGALRTRPASDWNFVTVQGSGHLVGSLLNVTNPVKGWWGEGDEKIFVDGESFPGIFGTGTEDYYGYAWINQDFFARPYHAQSRTPEGGASSPRNNFGRTSNVRWHVLDAIPFRRQLRFDMEVLHWSDATVHLDNTTFWYALPGAAHNIGEPSADAYQLPPLPSP